MMNYTQYIFRYNFYCKSWFLRGVVIRIEKNKNVSYIGFEEVIRQVIKLEWPY